jgi:hypothetical protein
MPTPDIGACFNLGVPPFEKNRMAKSQIGLQQARRLAQMKYDETLDLIAEGLPWLGAPRIASNPLEDNVVALTGGGWRRSR